MRKTRALALLLAVVMVLSTLPAVSAAGFNDVTSSDWFYGAVDYAVSNRLMGGYNATTFGPNDTLSRAMVVQVLYNKEGQPANADKHAFPDVKADDWFNNAVTWASKKGVVGGYGDGRFGPNDDVTLEQIAVILWNYSGNPSASADLSSAGKYSDWAANALKWAVSRGLLNGLPFSAVTEKATRAQTAQVLMNYLADPKIETDVTANGITLDITSHKMGEGWTQCLTATVSPEEATNTAITWFSSDSKIATVDQNGKVTGVAGGTANITAKTANGKSATCVVEVWHSHKLTDTKIVGTDGANEIYTCACGHSYEKWIPAVKVSSIGLGTATASVDVGKSITLKAAITPADATFKDIAWSSSDNSVATVSNGNITGVSPGTAKIYAVAGGVTAYCTVSVSAAPIVFKGSGSKVISGVNIPAGSYYVEYAYSGKSNFISHLYYGPDKYDYYSITNDIGPCAGRNELSAKIDAVVNGQLEITHGSGDWTIVFRPVGGSTTTNVKGTGFVVTGLFTATQSRYVVSMTHTGSSNFISHVVEYNADTRWSYQSLANEIGIFSGQKIINLEPGKQYYIYVDTGSDRDATWTIDFGLGDSVTTYKPVSLSGTLSSPDSNSSGTISPSTGSGSSGTASPSIGSGMERLAAHVRANGFVTDDGEYVITYSPDSMSNAFVSYNPSKNILQFLFGYEDASSETITSFEYDLTTKKAGPALFVFESSLIDFSGFSSFNMATFSSEYTTLYFTSASGSSLNSSANNVANAGFRLGMSSWALLLLVEAGMSMQDIGFLNY